MTMSAMRTSAISGKKDEDAQKGGCIKKMGERKREH